MRAVVVYESMYGNTRKIAESIADGLEPADVSVMSVAEADRHPVLAVDLLVVGAPTHAWGMSRPSTRRSAVEAGAKPNSGLRIEPDAVSAGVREWLDRCRWVVNRAAAFDTRMRAPMGLCGSAARKIVKNLRSRGHGQVAGPEGFFVTRDNRLVDGELKRAEAWGAHIGELAGSNHV